MHLQKRWMTPNGSDRLNISGMCLKMYKTKKAIAFSRSGDFHLQRQYPVSSLLLVFLHKNQPLFNEIVFIMFIFKKFYSTGMFAWIFFHIISFMFFCFFLCSVWTAVGGGGWLGVIVGGATKQLFMLLLTKSVTKKTKMKCKKNKYREKQGS